MNKLRILHLRSETAADFDAPLALAATGHEVVSTSVLPGNISHYDLFVIDVIQDGRSWAELAILLRGRGRLMSAHWEAIVIVFTEENAPKNNLAIIQEAFRDYRVVDCLSRSCPISEIRRVITRATEIFSAA